MIYGAAYDEGLGDQLRVTFIATGLNSVRKGGVISPPLSVVQQPMHNPMQQPAQQALRTGAVNLPILNQVAKVAQTPGNGLAGPPCVERVGGFGPIKNIRCREPVAPKQLVARRSLGRRHRMAHPSSTQWHAALFIAEPEVATGADLPRFVKGTNAKLSSTPRSGAAPGAAPPVLSVGFASGAGCRRCQAQFPGLAV